MQRKLRDCCDGTQCSKNVRCTSLVPAAEKENPFPTSVYHIHTCMNACAHAHTHRYIHGMQCNGRPGFKIKSNYFFHHKTICSNVAVMFLIPTSVKTKICFIISKFSYLGELVGLPWVGEARRGGKGGAGGTEVVTRRSRRGEERGDIMGLRPPWN